MFDILKESLPVLATTPQRWKQLTAALTPELLARIPAEGEWSALDCLQHLVDTERYVFPVRVRCFLNGEDFPAFDPDHQGEISSRTKIGPELAAELASMRAVSLKLLGSLTPADLDLKAVHGELGPAFTYRLGRDQSGWVANTVETVRLICVGGRGIFRRAIAHLAYAFLRSAGERRLAAAPRSAQCGPAVHVGCLGHAAHGGGGHRTGRSHGSGAPTVCVGADHALIFFALVLY